MAAAEVEDLGFTFTLHAAGRAHKLLVLLPEGDGAPTLVGADGDVVLQPGTLPDIVMQVHNALCARQKAATPAGGLWSSSSFDTEAGEEEEEGSEGEEDNIIKPEGSTELCPELVADIEAVRVCT